MKMNSQLIPNCPIILWNFKAMKINKKNLWSTLVICLVMMIETVLRDMNKSKLLIQNKNLF
jgi:hypothetical protein